MSSIPPSNKSQNGPQFPPSASASKSQAQGADSANNNEYIQMLQKIRKELEEGKRSDAINMLNSLINHLGGTINVKYMEAKDILMSVLSNVKSGGPLSAALAGISRATTILQS